MSTLDEREAALSALVVEAGWRIRARDLAAGRSAALFKADSERAESVPKLSELVRLVPGTTATTYAILSLAAHAKLFAIKERTEATGQTGRHGRSIRAFPGPGLGPERSVLLLHQCITHSVQSFLRWASR